jgi:hypothetical protein
MKEFEESGKLFDVIDRIGQEVIVVVAADFAKNELHADSLIRAHLGYSSLGLIDIFLVALCLGCDEDIEHYFLALVYQCQLNCRLLVECGFDLSGDSNFIQGVVYGVDFASAD